MGCKLPFQSIHEVASKCLLRCTALRFYLYFYLLASPSLCLLRVFIPSWKHRRKEEKGHIAPLLLQRMQILKASNCCQQFPFYLSTKFLLVPSIRFSSLSFLVHCSVLLIVFLFFFLTFILCSFVCLSSDCLVPH